MKAAIIALALSLFACKGPITPVQEQAVLTAEQTICIGFAAVEGASTPAEVKVLCPELPPLTADVIAAINSILQVANAQIDAFAGMSLDGGAK